MKTIEIDYVKNTLCDDISEIISNNIFHIVWDNVCSNLHNTILNNVRINVRSNIVNTIQNYKICKSIQHNVLKTLKK